MPTHSEVVRLNLEFYRKQAKALLKACKAGDSSALHRLQLYSSQLHQEKNPQAVPAVAALHDAQLAIAREQGFPSWPRLKAFIVESRLSGAGRCLHRRSCIRRAARKRNPGEKSEDRRCRLLCRARARGRETSRPHADPDTHAHQREERTAKLRAFALRLFLALRPSQIGPRRRSRRNGSRPVAPRR